MIEEPLLGYWLTTESEDMGQQPARVAAAVTEGLRGLLQATADTIVNSLRAPYRDIEVHMYEQATVTSAQYGLERMITARPFRAQRYPSGGRLELLEYAISLVTVDGFYAEFGVYKGESLHFMAAMIDRVAYGFDAFEGLPTDWFLSVKKGHFGQSGQAPELQAAQGNLRLLKGWFADTLPQFRESITGPAAFIHVNCDVYESTKTVFDVLGDRIVAGTVLLFSGYWNYPGWQYHEFKAFQEFCAAAKVKYRYIGFTPTMYSVAVVIESVGQS